MNPNDSKNIKVSISTKNLLDTFRYDKESYNTIILRLISDNSRFKEENNRLKSDADLFKQFVIKQDIEELRKEKNELLTLKNKRLQKLKNSKKEAKKIVL